MNLQNQDSTNQSGSNSSQVSFQQCDEQYFLKDLDTGSVKDIRFENNNYMVERISSMNSNDGQWEKFWNELYQTHNHLCQACQQNNMKLVKELLGPTYQLPVEINMKLIDQWTALHYACFEANSEIVQILLQNNAKPDVLNSIGKTPLHFSCIRGDLKSIDLLIQKNANINAQDNDLQTPLHYASYHGHTIVIEKLIEAGASLIIKNTFGFTPQDISLDANVLAIFKKHDPNGSSVYSRQQLGSVILSNSRQDHVLKFLNQKKKIYQPQQEIIRPKIYMHRVRRVEIQMKEKQNQSLMDRSFEVDQVVNIGPGDFIILQNLGKGAFGSVYLVKQKGTNDFFAMKVINKLRIFAANMHEYAKTERQVLTLVQSPFIVHLHYAFQTTNKLYLVMNYCPGGDLEQMLFRRGCLKESLVKMYIAEITLAIEALHANCVIFRDLKPSNVVIDADGHACLTDFGLSKRVSSAKELTQSFCGSLVYLAPEMLERRGHSFALDWYLLGVLTYELLDGYPPYYDQDKDTLFENIKNGVLKMPQNVSSECADFITKLLERDPQKRLGSKLGAQEIKDHPFFSEFKWDIVYNRGLKLPKPSNQLKQYQETEDSDMRVTFSSKAETSKENKTSECHLMNWSFAHKDNNASQTRKLQNESFLFRN